VSRPRTAQQLAAAGERQRDVFLRAGAGTGKTTVLVDRFCAAALDPEVGVDAILAFTFTERAADQLRHRVREELTWLAAEAEGERLEALVEARAATDRAWISTIHGFCRRLLSTHPAAAGIDPRFRVLDEPEADRLAGWAFDDALEALVEAGGAEGLELAAANRRRTLLEMTRGAYDELRSHGDPSPALPDPPPADPAAAIEALVAAAKEAHEECAEASGQALQSRERIAAAIELSPSAIPDVELLETLQRLDIRTSAAAFKGEACERYKRKLKLARSAVAGHALAPAYAQLRALIEDFGRRYEVLKAERSALDFEDLQLKAVGLLRTSDAVRERYREQFSQLMVDEFQDTNSLQLSLIEQLHGPGTKLFVVGDEFQSIYGFRHANVDVYRREHGRFAEGAPERVALPLTGNFRAAPEILATTNAIGGGLLNDFEPLSAGLEEPEGNGGGPLVELLLTVDDKRAWEAEETELPRLPDDPSSGSKVAEARRLAGRLRELVDAGEDPAEIVVLLRAFTHIGTLERALGEAGLDPYVVGGRGFWSQQQIEDLRCLLQVISNPLDDEALFGALASPAAALLPDTLWLLRQAATVPGDNGRDRLLHIWPLVRDLTEKGAPTEGDAEAAALIPPGELERLGEFAAMVGPLRERGAEGGLEALIDRVVTKSGYDLATLAREDGPARWANVRKLMRLAREFESREGPDLAAFLEYLDSRSAQRDRESEAATRSEGHSGVRVMTVHAAKGLEFGVVAVADLGRNLQLGWTPLRVAPGEDVADGGEAMRVGVQLGRLGRASERLHSYDELQDLAADREAEEEARLAYVAATRAERRLLLSGTFSPKGVGTEPIARKPISLQLIRSLLGDDTEPREIEIPAPAPGLPEGRLLVSVSEPGPGAGARLLTQTPPETEEPEPRVSDPPLARPEVQPALVGGLSYSALSEYKRCGYRFYVERVLGIGEPEHPFGEGTEGNGGTRAARRRYGPGVAVHSLLEWGARNAWRDPGPERAAAALREQELEGSPEEVDRALALARAWADSPLIAELEGCKLTPEAPFVLSVADTLVRGSIDLLAERPDGGAIVVDYKTDRLDGGDPGEAAARYAVQRDLYALAASSRGAPLQTAYVFLEQPGEPIVESFDPEGLEQARARVEAIVEELGAGHFEVTPQPHAALCHDCPARHRLCSYPKELTLRESPAPVVAEDGGELPDSQMSLLDGS
jgi:ATP-dependent helicase/nuclease subunit A